MPQAMMPHTDHDDLVKNATQAEAETPTPDALPTRGLSELRALPQQRQTQSVRQSAAQHLSRQIGNQAFIRRMVNAVQREDVSSGEGDAQEQGATASPVDTPEERKKRAIKGALLGSQPVMKIATEMCGEPASSGSVQGNADQVLGATSSVSKALTDAKNTQ
ncbi:MAG: hypothetical protein K8L91_28745 [Anaerolineae bacterium]|nr:hypothetical protein [Anaerolineae bacterium]